MNDSGVFVLLLGMFSKPLCPLHLSKLQVLPTDAKPVSRWSDCDDVFWDITQGLRKVVRGLQALLKDKEAWVKEGITFYNLKRYEEALQAYDRAIQFDPSDAIAYHDKGNVLRP